MDEFGKFDNINSDWQIPDRSGVKNRNLLPKTNEKAGKVIPGFFITEVMRW